MVSHDDDSTSADGVAIVTEGAHGVGREVTRRLAARGYAVVVSHARDRRAADAIVEEILAAHGSALVVHAVTTDELDVERLFTETIEWFGGVDVVVHTARPTVHRPLVDPDADSSGRSDRRPQAEVRAALAVCREASRRLRDRGAIVTLSDAAHPEVKAITRQLAHNLHARDITINLVASRPQHPSGATLADLIAFLVSPDGHSLSGLLIRLDDTSP